MAKKTSKNRSFSFEEKVEIIEDIIEDIYENALSTKEAILRSGKISTSTFHEVLNKDDSLSEKYARAKDSAIEQIYDEAISEAKRERISKESKKGIDDIKGSWEEEKQFDNVNRSKLIVDALCHKARSMARKNTKEDKKDNKVIISFEEAE